jgi:hydrogenase maturation protein HypF
LLDSSGIPVTSKHEAILLAVKYVKEGRIVALKGIGGYQLLADATNSAAVVALRTRKRRNEKPFALMFPDLESVKIECELNEIEEGLLNSIEKPIVLLRRKNSTNSNIAEEAAINNPYLGVMLPYSPLHHILMKELNSPVIATSGNLSEEPICIDEKTAIEKLTGIADYFLIHNRKILRHVDDSIARVIAGREMLIRRARGYAPLPVNIEGLNGYTLAAGAHLKNTIAVNNNENVFISQHIGDLENLEAINAFKEVINDLKEFYGINPCNIVTDLHPDYVSTKFASKLNGKHQQVQHHYAHILSCMAENNIECEVLGVSWDGTGYGTDGTIWGSEFLISKGKDFKRAAHLKPFRLPGGEKAIHEIWRTGFALLYEVYGTDAYKLLGHKEKDSKIIEQMLVKGINSPITTSMGRLFDGVASILSISQYAHHEAQAAMELEFAATSPPAPLHIERGDEYYRFSLMQNHSTSTIINWYQMIKEIVDDNINGISVNTISAKFHNTLVEMIVSVAKELKYEKVVLTGGCFQNKYLLERAIDKLRQNGFKVYWHQRVPTNDGGISLGQVKYASY